MPLDLRTDRTDRNVMKPGDARNISYYDSDYEKTLRAAFGDVNSQEDFLSQLTEVWVPLGSGTITSVDRYYPIRNFTDEFNVHLIRIYGLTVSANNKTVNYVLSTDNGITWDSTICFVANRASSGALVNVLGTTNAPSFQWGLIPPTMTGTDHEYVLELVIHNAGNADLLTHCTFTQGWFMETSGTPGTPLYAEGGFSVRELVANNAFALELPNDGTTFTGGKIDVWGLEK
ncbi:hypothetical protein KC963_00115 [Candidatus Saccharibacteria bacterium]|nr:hypothetical protein [Candidatus Saccharibacteria bacterium]